MRGRQERGMERLGIGPAVLATVVILAALAISIPVTGQESGQMSVGQQISDIGVHGSPAVVNSTVYISSTNNRVYALDAETGDEQWNFTTNGRIRSSPAVVNGNVYIGSGDGNLYALDATTGTKEWNYSVPGRLFSSPAVANGTVYIGNNRHNLFAVDAETGEEEWTFTTGHYAIHSSPAVVNGTVYVGTQDGYFYALDAATGAEEWHFRSGKVISSPAVASNTVYFGSKNGKVYAVNASTGAEHWNITTGGAVSSSPAVVNGTVYVGSEDGNVYALTGETSSTTATDESSSPAAEWSMFRANLAHTGHLETPGPTSNITIQWNVSTGGKVKRSSPAVVDGTVYIGSHDNNVYALNATTGAQRWTFATNGSIRSSPAVVDGTVYVANLDGNLYALDLDTGSKQWNFTAWTTPEPWDPTPVYPDGKPPTPEVIPGFGLGAALLAMAAAVLLARRL